jgi:hypothetical protein
MEKGCSAVRDKEGKTAKYPLFESEIGEIQLKIENHATEGTRP